MRVHRALVLLACCAAPVAGNVRATEPPPSMIRTDSTLSSSGGKRARIVVFDLDPGRTEMKVLGAVTLKAEGKRGGSGVSVREAARSRQILALVDGELLLINGGFSGNQTSEPVGALISDGAMISLPQYARRPADPKSACAFRRVESYRLSGLICGRPDGAIEIGTMRRITPGSCRNALQAGPVLVEKANEAALCSGGSNNDLYERTALCTAAKRLRVVVTTDPVSLFDLAQWMSKPERAGGLGCSQAVNLSGDTSSGAAYWASRNTPPTLIGPGNYPEASLVVFMTRH